MTSFDLKEAYFTLPIHKCSTKLEFHKITYNFYALLQSFKDSLRVFIKTMKPVLDYFKLQAYILRFTLMIYIFRAPPLIDAKNAQYTRSLIQSFGFTFQTHPLLFHAKLYSTWGWY